MIEAQRSIESQTPLEAARESGPVRRRWRFWSTRSVPILLIVGALFWFIPPVWKLLGGPITVTRWTKKTGQIEAVVGPGQKGWADLKKISKHAIYAVIAAEDGKFYQHAGFDFESIRRAYETNIKRGRYVRGGSTISQQTVKMAFLGREKTMVRKAREALGTLLIEWLLTKEQILEWYLNLAEFGDSVYGIHNGAQHYFRTRPELLTIEQAIHLALVLPSPNHWSRGLRNRHLSEFGHRRFAAIANNMKASGHISKAQWATTMRSGNFGRPIAGYQAMIAAENKGEALCPGDPSCPEEMLTEAIREDDSEDVIIAGPETSPAVTPSSVEPQIVTNSSPGAVGADKTEAAPGTTGESSTATDSATTMSVLKTDSVPVQSIQPAQPSKLEAVIESTDQEDDDESDF